MYDPAPSSRPPAPGWLRVVVLLLAAVYVVVIGRHISPHAGGSDSSGYLNSARLLSRGDFFVPARTVAGHSSTEFGDAAFQPLGFKQAGPTGRMAPTYPIGLPLHLLAAAGLVGWSHAVAALNLATVLGCGWLVWLLARRLSLDDLSAATAVLWLWLCPLLIFSALQPMSDLLAVMWSLATIFCALKGRESWRWGLATGFSLSVAVLVRPTNILLLAPVLAALGLRWRAYLPVVAAGLPGAAVLFFYNWRVYGSPLTTGYGDVSVVFGSKFLPHNLAHFGQWIPALLSPLVVLALLVLFLPVLRQRGYVVLVTWFVTLTGFYAFYFHSGETWWYLRFILPAFPVLILTALAAVPAGTSRVPGWSGQWTTIATAVVALGAAGWEIRQARQLDVLAFEQDERSYPTAAEWAKANLPARSAVFCMQVSGAFFYYTDFLLLRWEQVDADKYTPLLAAVAQEGRPVYAALYPFETPEALEKIGGHWTKLATTGQVTFWQRQP